VDEAIKVLVSDVVVDPIIRRRATGWRLTGRHRSISWILGWTARGGALQIRVRVVLCFFHCFFHVSMMRASGEPFYEGFP